MWKDHLRTLHCVVGCACAVRPVRHVAGPRSKPVKFDLFSDRGSVSVSLMPRLGDLLRPLTVEQPQFERAQLGARYERQ